ncbi:MMPL family transporter [Kitasatospora sp. NPDC127121]|uniref:MMPL family transporter n=1 Tax=Kitasatospora sp. NPDC127121 TaxID=3345371 RepID=UPI003625CDCA
MLRPRPGPRSSPTSTTPWTRTSRAELWLFPALFILLLLFIRSLTAALLPLAVAGASLALSFAVLGWAGIPGRGGRGSVEMPYKRGVG